MTNLQTGYIQGCLDPVRKNLGRYCDMLMSLDELKIGHISSHDRLILGSIYGVPFERWGALKGEDGWSIYCLKGDNGPEPITSEMTWRLFGDYFRSPGDLREDLVFLREAREDARAYEEYAIIQIQHPAEVCRDHLMRELLAKAQAWAVKESEDWIADLMD